MSWRDRPYSDGGYGQQPQMRLNLRKPSNAVMCLIIANIIIHFVNVFVGRWNHGAGLGPIFGLSMQGINHFYLWQPVTYMFLHSTDGIFHLLMNMLGLYVFGTEFENQFGRNRFLQFYGTCGIIGGLAYLLLGLIWPGITGPFLIGASGAIYGLLMAAIIFFPHIQIILVVFPVPVRVFGLIIAAILLLQLLAGNMQNTGGEVCHIAGAFTAVGIFSAWGIMPGIRIGSPDKPSFAERRRQGAWKRRQKKLADEQAQVDRILAKVHDQGIHSLSRKERKTLEQATRRQKNQDDRLGRIDRL